MNSVNIENLHYFLLDITKYISSYLMIGVIAFKFAYRNRPNAFYYVFVASCIVFLENLLKMIY